MENYYEHLRIKEREDPKEIETIERRMCRGWCIGEKDFKKAVAKDFFEKKGSIKLEKDELDEFNQIQWKLQLAACLKKAGQTKSDANLTKYSEDWKIAIACKLKTESSVTNAWLAEQLNMGVPNSVSDLCGSYQRNGKKKRRRKL